MFYLVQITIDEAHVRDVYVKLSKFYDVSKILATPNFLLTFRVVRIQAALQNLDALGIGIDYGKVDIIPTVLSMPGFLGALRNRARAE